MLSTVVPWLLLGVTVLALVVVLAVVTWRGRSTRGKHSYYASQVSVRGLATLDRTRPTWPHDDHDPTSTAGEAARR